MKRFVLLALLSVVIFEARSGALAYALVAAAAAAFAAARLPRLPPARVRIGGLAAFMAFFFRESLRGGLDVALRAFRGRSALRPGFIDYPLRLGGPSARVLFFNAVSLMPGTLSARIGDDALRVHTLDTREAVTARLRQAEDRIAGIFTDAQP